MPVKSVRSPDLIKLAIAEKSIAVKNAANELSARIQCFEAWLGKLPGRVETYCYETHPDAVGMDPLELGLRLHREGKKWVLSYTNYHPSLEPDGIDWTPLSEAPLQLKLAAVEMFPNLLAAIENSQEKLAARINMVCTTFDSFASKVGMSGKEGE